MILLLNPNYERNQAMPKKYPILSQEWEIVKASFFFCCENFYSLPEMINYMKEKHNVEKTTVTKIFRALLKGKKAEEYLRESHIRMKTRTTVQDEDEVARSEVFKKILEPDEFKAPTKLVETITLWEMKHEEVEALLEFIYSRDGSISSEGLKKHARALFLAADKYEIPHLRDICRDELISSLSPSNALSILDLAQIPFDKALNDAALLKIIINISTIASGDEFEQFILNHPNLAVKIIKASVTPLSSTEYCNVLYVKK